ncbi:MAG: helix-turn-helix domain-containing protein [Bacteroides sp.]|nr:helix-turn-helix domain-containing protein [Bacteroides sp.]
MELQTDTELKIVASAEKLFYQKGKAGTSMQDIADDAGINRTLLNYYFRTKDQLFEAVFRKAMAGFVPTVAALFSSDIAFEKLVPKLIHTIIDAMIASPQIPIFVLQELSSNPDRMPQVMRDLGVDPQLVISKVEDQAHFMQLIMNLISLCIFPFAARPVVTGLLFNGDNDAFVEAMHQRKEILPKMFLNLMSQNQ